MILRVFSIYDIKAEVFSPPFFLPSKGEALRAFQDLANDTSTMVGRHPGDYQLRMLGEFDNINGQFLLLGPIPENLGFASEFKSNGGVPIGVANG